MLALATYNIHACVGADRQFNPLRVAHVIRGLHADVVALQEVDARLRPGGFVNQWTLLAESTGYRCIPGISLRTGRNAFGNALLVRHPVLGVELHDLSVVRREPRGAIEVMLRADGRILRVIATHFGLRWHERRRQAERLAEIVGQRTEARATVLLGDLNEWRPMRVSIQPLLEWFDPTPAHATFPSRCPMLPLDRILVRGALRLRQVLAGRSKLERLASDHLPLCACAVWTPGE